MTIGRERKVTIGREREVRLVGKKRRETKRFNKETCG